MPYGPTKFVNGQNEGAQPLMTQVVKSDIKVIVPARLREAKPVFPKPKRLSRGAAGLLDFAASSSPSSSTA